MFTVHCSLPRELCSRGLTLIETIVVIGILSLLLIAVYNLSSGYSSLSALQDAGVETAGSARRALDEIGSAARQAARVAASHSFSSAPYSSGTSTLVLEVPAANAAGDMLPNTYDYFAFYTSGTGAYRLVEAAAGSARTSGQKTLSESVRALSFSYDTPAPADASFVETAVSTFRQTSLSSASTTLRERVYLRNK